MYKREPVKFLTVGICHHSSAQKTKEMSDILSVLEMLGEIISKYPNFSQKQYEFEYSTKREIFNNPYDITVFEKKGHVFIHFHGKNWVLNITGTNYDNIGLVEKKIEKFYRRAKLGLDHSR